MSTTVTIEILDCYPSSLNCLEFAFIFKSDDKTFEDTITVLNFY